MAPTSAGSDSSRFADRLSSVSVDMLHRATGNSHRALLDRLRLRSLQNLSEEQRVVSTAAQRGSLRPVWFKDLDHTDFKKHVPSRSHSQSMGSSKSSRGATELEGWIWFFLVLVLLQRCSRMVLDGSPSVIWFRFIDNKADDSR